MVVSNWKRWSSHGARLRSSAALIVIALVIAMGLQGNGKRNASDISRTDAPRSVVAEPTRAASPSPSGAASTGAAHPDICAMVRDFERSLDAVPDLNRTVNSPRESGCLHRLAAILSDSILHNGGERYYDAFAALARIAEGDVGAYYDSLCAKLYHAATVSTMDYLYGRAIGRYSEMVSHTRNGLALEIDGARDSAAAWRSFEGPLRKYAADDSTPRRRLNAELLRAGVLGQLGTNQP